MIGHYLGLIRNLFMLKADNDRKSPHLFEQRKRKEGCPDSASARLDGVVFSRGLSANNSPPRPFAHSLLPLR